MENNELPFQWSDEKKVPANGLVYDPDILSYFCESPFWNPESTTAYIIQMQSSRQPINVQKVLLERKGIQYEIHRINNTLIAILEYNRLSPTFRKIQMVYYLVGTSIYQANSFETILKTRLATFSIKYANEILETQTNSYWDPSCGILHRDHILQHLQPTNLSNELENNSSPSQKS